MSNEKGFTLIEVIASLVLIGILAAVAGMGLVKITEGYVFAKKNAETVQKAQIAMARIVKELSAVCYTPSPCLGITAASENSVTYTRTGSGSVIITFSNPNITVQVNGTATPLIDNVTGFTLDYYGAAGGSKLPVPVAVANIRQIYITLTLRGANDQLSTFNNRVNISEFY